MGVNEVRGESINEWRVCRSKKRWGVIKTSYEEEKGRV
jgi:hypothetical protein